MVWDDIDERTFTSFWQYVYIGDYDAPEELMTTGAIANGAGIQEKAEADNQSSPEEVDAQPEEPERVVYEDQPTLVYEEKPALDGWTRPDQNLRKKKKKKKAKQVMLWKQFQSAWKQDFSSYRGEAQQMLEPKSHGDIFIHHSKVYILADRYYVDRLMRLSLSKLHQALTEFTLSETRLDDITALLRFCYAESIPEKLRQLTAQYVACHVEQLWKSDKFQQLLEEYGSLSRALIGSMLFRLD